MKKILVTGANGQLGQCIKALDKSVSYEFIFTDHLELDITDEQAVVEVLEREKPDWIINCAAYTAVDKAEEDRELAEKINATAVGVLARESRKNDASIVHISTDYVFDGENPNPYKETDQTSPQSVYGQTKLKGEILAKQNPKHIIIRTSWLYSPYGNNFVKTMRSLGSSKAEISVVADQWGSPTSAEDLARAILVAIEKEEYGTYHFSNEGVTNWAIFAEKIMEYFNLKCKVNHINTEDYPTVAQRPQYSILDKHKFCETFSTVIPEWENSLEKVCGELYHN